MDKKKVLAGRKIVDTYHKAHAELYVNGWHRGLSEEHIPIGDKMRAGIEALGFVSFQEFFDADKELKEEEG